MVLPRRNFTHTVRSLPDLVAALQSHGAKRIIIGGAPATGKTKLAAQIADALQIPEVRHADNLFTTHSLIQPHGPPNAAELEQMRSGETSPAIFEGCAFLTEIQRWLQTPAPWIVEGSVVVHAWCDAMERAGIPAGVDAAILCRTMLREAPMLSHWSAQDRQIAKLLSCWEPDFVFADGLLCEWAPLDQVTRLRDEARRLRAIIPPLEGDA